MRRPILTLAAAAALVAAACGGGTATPAATPASSAPSVAPSTPASAPPAGSAAAEAPSQAAASFSTGEYGTITPLKPAVDLSTVGGAGEGALNLIIWGGYAEDGSNVPEYDWVKPFEAETGCQVKTKIGNTSDEMVTLVHSGGYDGVSASGDATLRLIPNGDVAAIDPATIPGSAMSRRSCRTPRTTSSTASTTARRTPGAATPCSPAPTW
jgi:spermidine/putrescine-binding protein